MSLEYRLRYSSGQLDDFVFKSRVEADGFLETETTFGEDDHPTVVACDNSHWKEVS